jgi:hypothetical protein
MSGWIEKPSVINESNGSSVLRTYAVHVKVGSPYPCPKNATPRMIGDEFVWERLIQSKGRAKAVEEATKWFRKTKPNYKSVKDKAAHECVTVDDKAGESNFGSDFKPTKSVNRLLDKETIARLLDESKGLLKVCDSPFKLGQTVAHPSLDWVEGANKVNKSPIKIGFSAYSDPKGGMKDELEEASKKARALKKEGTDWLRETMMDENRRIIKKMRANGSIGDNRPYWKPKIVSNE